MLFETLRNGGAVALIVVLFVGTVAHHVASVREYEARRNRRD